MSKSYFIELKSLTELPCSQQFTIDDSFFSGDEDKQEIKGGNLNADVKISSLGDSCFRLDIELSGEVEVLCDRCLAPLKLEVEASDTIRVKEDDGIESDDDDLMVMAPAETGVDIEWRLYELIALSLPMQRVHDDGECDQKMLDILNGCSTQPEQESENPMWEALKSLKNK